MGLAKTRLISMSESICIFCKIAAGEIPTEFVAQTEHTLAFRDISPLAKVHLLVIPRNHHANVVELTENEPKALADLMQTATRLALEHTNGSFKLQFNTGSEAGQTVFHAHAHVLADTAKETA
jgi:histidine triad (HIT) family protein